MAAPNAKIKISILDKTKRGASSARRNLNNIAGAAAKLTIGLAAVGVAGFSVLIKGALRSNDALAKTADRIGITTESLRGLQLAGELAGVGTSSLNKSLERLNVRIGEAQRGTGLAKQSLDELNLSASGLAQLRSEERFLKIAGAIGQVTDRTKQAKIATDLFGRSGGELLVLFDGGVENIRKTVDEAQKLGTSLNRVDAAKIEQANDAITRLKAVGEGVINRVAVKLAPIIEGVSVALKDAALETGGFQFAIDKAFRISVRAVGFLADTFRGLQVTFGLIKIAILGVATGITKLANTSLRFFESFGPNIVNFVLSPFKRLIKFQSLAVRGFGALTGVQGIEDLGRKIQRVGESIDINLVGKLKDSTGVLSEVLNDNLKQALKETSDLAAKPLPSEGIKSLVKSYEEASQKIAEQTASIRNSQNSVSADGSNNNPDNQKERDRIKQKLDLLRQETSEELQVLRERAALKLEQQTIDLEKSQQIGLISEERKNALLEDLRKNHKDKLIEIEANAARKQLDLQRNNLNSLLSLENNLAGAQKKVNTLSKEQKVSLIKDSFRGALAAAASGSKKLFEINKKVSIAESLISTYRAITNALSVQPFPVGLGLAALAAAKGFAQVKSIQSTKFSGGNASGGSVGGAPAPISTQNNPVAPPVTAPAPPSKKANVVIEGGLDSRQQIESFAKELVELRDDGYTDFNVNIV